MCEVKILLAFSYDDNNLFSLSRLGDTVSISVFLVLFICWTSPCSPVLANLKFRAWRSRMLVALGSDLAINLYILKFWSLLACVLAWPLVYVMARTDGLGHGYRCLCSQRLMCLIRIRHSRSWQGRAINASAMVLEVPHCDRRLYITALYKSVGLSRGTDVRSYRRSLAGELSLSCARHAADG